MQLVLLPVIWCVGAASSHEMDRFLAAIDAAVTEADPLIEEERYPTQLSEWTVGVRNNPPNRRIASQRLSDKYLNVIADHLCDVEDETKRKELYHIFYSYLAGSLDKIFCSLYKSEEIIHCLLVDEISHEPGESALSIYEDHAWVMQNWIHKVYTDLPAVAQSLVHMQRLFYIDISGEFDARQRHRLEIFESIITPSMVLRCQDFLNNRLWSRWEIDLRRLVLGRTRVGEIILK